MLSFGEENETKMVFLSLSNLLLLVSSLWSCTSDRRIFEETWISTVHFPHPCMDCQLIYSFLTDSSGTYTEYKAVSIGAGCEGATDMLKDLYKPVGKEKLKCNLIA